MFEQTGNNLCLSAQVFVSCLTFWWNKLKKLHDIH